MSFTGKLLSVAALSSLAVSAAIRSILAAERCGVRFGEGQPGPTRVLRSRSCEVHTALHARGADTIGTCRRDPAGSACCIYATHLLRRQQQTILACRRPRAEARGSQGRGG